MGGEIGQRTATDPPSGTTAHSTALGGLERVGLFFWIPAFAGMTGGRREWQEGGGNDKREKGMTEKENFAKVSRLEKSRVCF